MNQNTDCKLCGKTAKLLNKSHIIPSFMFKNIKDGQAGMLVLDKSAQNRTHRIQTPIFEKYILCDSCDNNLLGNLERYAANFMSKYFDKGAVPQANGYAHGMRMIKMSGVDHHIFTRFLLSIVWRFGVSKHNAYNQASMSTHQNILRDIILENVKPNKYSYRVGIIAIQAENDKLIRVGITSILHVDGLNGMVIFFVGGLLYYVELGKIRRFKLFDEIHLQRSGKLKIPVLGTEQGLQVLGGVWKLLPSTLIHSFRNSAGY